MRLVFLGVVVTKSFIDFYFSVIITHYKLKNRPFYDTITVKVGEKMTDYKEIGNARKILKFLKADIPVACYDTIDSTNNHAKRYCEKHKDNSLGTPMLFVAEHQSAGRGRLGRNFYSPSDTGLYMSLYINTDESFSDIVCMTTATAVCVCEALESLCDIKPLIKWVNDIYIDNKKVCGILCEAVTNPVTSTINGIIIGIGININTTDFPDDIKDIAVSLNKDIDKMKLCALITDNILEMYNNISDRSFIEEYKSRSMVLGREITYTENGVTKTAKATDIDKNGGLVIFDKNTEKTLSSGEISVRLNRNEI